jgi:TetR/AcrR family transcriptional regulator, transcriptional repressor for nem operon
VLHTAIVRRVRDAQAEGDAASDVDPEQAAAFLSASFAGIRIAARAARDPSS